MKLSKLLLRTMPQSIRVIRRLAVQQSGELPLLHLRVLTLVSVGQGQAQIAETLQISAAAVSKVMSNLVEMKHVTKECGSDRRCFQLKLTTKGEKYLSEVGHEVEKMLDKEIRTLTKEEQADLQKGVLLLEKLFKKLN